MNKAALKKVQLALIMMLNGTIGVITRFIDMPSASMCCIRAFIAASIILAYLYAANKRPDMAAIKAELGTVIGAGISLGLIWLFIFEAFNRTTVAIASVCFYTEPVIFLVAASLLFREKLSRVKVACVLCALAGTVLISGILSGSMEKSSLSGVICALMAALSYAVNVLLNKKVESVSPVDMTVAQMIIAGIVTLPYAVMVERVDLSSLSALSITLLLVLAVVYTALGYFLYYDAVAWVDSGTIAVLSYLDPLVSVLLSVLFLHEAMTAPVFAGIVLIFTSAFLSEAADRQSET